MGFEVCICIYVGDCRFDELWNYELCQCSPLNSEYLHMFIHLVPSSSFLPQSSALKVVW
jgi:hypothetical protein